jgi:3'(2'), 5'-bisphosphate nucleotidase
MSTSALWAVLEEQLVPVFADYRSRIAEVPVEVKADRTLLTAADITVQELIVSAIRATEPDAVIIAEEDERNGPRSEITASRGRVWVIDPIDGTSQFINGESVEFCSVVCLLDDWEPAEAFVLAPELGAGRTPLLATANARTRTIMLGGLEVQTPPTDSRMRWLSVTRSTDEPPRPLEAAAVRDGYRAKTRTTSQTLDLLRTVLDISSLTEPPLPYFSLFWRRDQKLWDGAAGLCLAAAAELRACDEHGRPLPLGPRFLSQSVPTFPSTVIGRPETVAWFLNALRP